jgi:FKBP-type peptidyl-prolyl cis-trans isomerase FkpA
MNRFSLLRPVSLLAGAALVAGLMAPLLCAAQTAKPVGNSSTAAAANGVGTAVTTSSGLVFKLVKQGTGPSPKASDTVKVHYRGTFQDGKEFDSSYSRGKPLEFPLNGVIKCWTEGVQRLQVGGSAKLTCPPAIAYGERGAGGVIPPNATLNFDVELLGIVPH